MAVRGTVPQYVQGNGTFYATVRLGHHYILGNIVLQATSSTFWVMAYSRKLNVQGNVEVSLWACEDQKTACQDWHNPDINPRLDT